MVLPVVPFPLTEMVTPVTAYSTSVRLPASGPAERYAYTSGFKQKPPYTLDTSLDAFMCRLTILRYGSNPGMSNAFSSFSGGVPWTLFSTGPGSTDRNAAKFEGAVSDAMNRALSRLQGDAYDEEATLGATIGETRESIESFQKRVVQLYRGFKALKSLRFYDVAYEFGLVRNKRPKKRRVGKTGKLYWAKHPLHKKYYPVPRKRVDGRYVVQSFAGLVLEYNFGWAPLVREVQAAIAVMQRDPYVERDIRGSASARVVVKDNSTTSSYDHYHTHTVSVMARAGATYRVTNPNYDLASRLGLVNLATVVLELTPFSFVANWFVNLEEFTGNLSAGYRSSCVSPWHAWRATATHEYRIWYKTPKRWDQWSVSTGDSYKRRAGSLPAVALRVRQRFMPSFTRAANASSLLVVLFSKKS